MSLFSRRTKTKEISTHISPEVLSRLSLSDEGKEVLKTIRVVAGDRLDIYIRRAVDCLYIEWVNSRTTPAGQSRLLGYRREGGYGQHDPLGSFAENGVCVVDSTRPEGSIRDYIPTNTTQYYTFIIKERNKYYEKYAFGVDTTTEFHYPAYLRFEERLLPPEEDEAARIQKEIHLLEIQRDRAIAVKDKILRERELDKLQSPPRQLSEAEQIIERTQREIERENAKLKGVREADKYLHEGLNEIKEMKKKGIYTATAAKGRMEQLKDSMAKVVQRILDRQ
jgi:hypothetical protein